MLPPERSETPVSVAGKVGCMSQVSHDVLIDQGDGDRGAHARVHGRPGDDRVRLGKGMSAEAERTSGRP